MQQLHIYKKEGSRSGWCAERLPTLIQQATTTPAVSEWVSEWVDNRHRWCVAGMMRGEVRWGEVWGAATIQSQVVTMQYWQVTGEEDTITQQSTQHSSSQRCDYHGKKSKRKFSTAHNMEGKTNWSEWIWISVLKFPLVWSEPVENHYNGHHLYHERIH